MKGSARLVSATLFVSLIAGGAAAQTVVPAGPPSSRVVPAPGTVISAVPGSSNHDYLSAAATRGDSLWNGILIGAGVGALYGMAIAPRQFCGSNDPECDAIVRVAVGLPSIGAGAGIGALIDYLVGRERPESAAARHRIRVAPIAGRGMRGVQARIVF